MNHSLLKQTNLTVSVRPLNLSNQLFNYLIMNLHNKSSIFTGAIFLFLISSISPAIALTKEPVQYVAQS